MVEGFSVGKRKRRTLCGTAFFRKRLLAELQLIERNEFNDSPVFNCLQKLPALNGSDVPGLKNKKAQTEYKLEKEFVAGLVLTGGEVKSLRAKSGSLNGSFVKILSGEAFLIRTSNSLIRRSMTSVSAFSDFQILIFL